MKSVGKLLIVSFTTSIILIFLLISPTQDDENHQLNKYQFLTLPNSSCVCEGTILIIVATKPSNFEKRSMIRRTWKRDAVEQDVNVFFMVGKTSDEEIRMNLTKEILEHGDFIQGDFDDTYRNLTLKHMISFKYVKIYCQNLKYVIKTDDDTFVYIRILKQFLDEYHGKHGNSRNILCTTTSKAPVQRHGKWSVSQVEYAEKFYPTYCFGYFIIYPRETINLLYAASANKELFWIEDIFVTGVLARKAHVSHTNIHGIIWIQNKTRPFIVSYNLALYDIQGFWNFIQDPEDYSAYNLLDLIA